MSDIQAIKQFHTDKLEVRIFENRAQMGKAAALEFAHRMNNLRSVKDELRMVFAAAPSQLDFLNSLSADKTLNWECVTAFHMDEYVGISKTTEQSFATWLKNKFFQYHQFKKIHYLNGEAENQNIECERYNDLINADVIDMIALGIGENGHIAFNDPPVADFNEKETVKIVELDHACKVQQVNDGCFKNIETVPVNAYTLTVPALVNAQNLICVVPGKQKAKAVFDTLNGDISTACPASILRTHANTVLFLDKESASLL